MKKVLLIGLLLSLTACSFFSNEPEMEASEELTTQEENQESTAPAVQPVDLQEVAPQTQETQVQDTQTPESQELSSDDSSMENPQAEASADSVSDESQSAPALEEDVSSDDTQSDDSQEPAADEPVTDDTQEPAADEPATDDTQEPAADEPTTDDSQEPAADEPTTDDSQEPAADEPTTDDTQEPAADDVVVEPVNYSVDAFDFGYSSSTLNAKVGQQVTVTLNNTGTGSHNFVIDALSVNSGVISGGESTTFTFTPSQSGTFEFYCSIGSHKNMGMLGSLVVSE